MPNPTKTTVADPPDDDGGLGDLIGRLGLGQDIWPNGWSQDVAFVAFVIKQTREMLVAAVTRAERADALLREAQAWLHDKDGDRGSFAGDRAEWYLREKIDVHLSPEPKETDRV